MVSLRSFLTMPVFLCFTITCARVPDTGAHRFFHTTEEGVPTAVTTGGPKFEGELFKYEHFLTLQQDPEVEESLLTHPEAFTRDETGRYYVLDIYQRRVAVFDPAGLYLRSIGRRGQGPGEFMTPGLQYVRDGVVSIWDGSTHRTTRITTDGTFIETIPMPLGCESSLRGLFHATSGGLIGIRPEVGGADSIAVRVRFWDAEGNLAATVETPPQLQVVRRTIPGSSPTPPIYIPFTPLPTAVCRPGRGVLVSAGHEPILWWYGETGTLESRIRLACLDSTLTREDRERFDRLWEERLAESPERASEVRIWSNHALLPSHPAYWTYALIDDAGYIWLRTNDQFYFDLVVPEGMRHYLLSPEGEYLGLTRVPPIGRQYDQQVYLMPISVAYGHFMGISDDPETGGKLLQVYRLVPAVEGFSYP